MVVLNRIYTKTGDDGTTALGSGERRPKYDLRISAYGTVDETNAAIGVVRLHLGEARDLDAMLGRIQNDLFDLGADLAVRATARRSACVCCRARSSVSSATSMGSTITLRR
jgi:cob(I)alamin adenosyltransferase